MTLTIRVPMGLKEKFNELCKKEDTSASRELRQFMRRYIEEKEKKR